MKKFYLAVDAFDFHTPQKTFLAVHENNKILNISNYNSEFEVDTQILEEYMDRNEIYRHNLYVVDDDIELNPFIHTTTIVDDDLGDTTPCINIIFNKNTSQDFIDQVMETVVDGVIFNGIRTIDLENISYEISNEDFCYKSIEEINKEFVLSGMICFVDKNNSISSLNKSEDFDYIRKIISNAKETTSDKNTLITLERLDTRINKLEINKKEEQ